MPVKKTNGGKKLVVYLCSEFGQGDGDLYVEWSKQDAERYQEYYEIRLPVRQPSKGKCLGVLEI